MKLKEKNINIVIENNIFSKNKECCECKDNNNSNINKSLGSKQIHEREYNNSLSPEVNAYYILQSQKRLQDFATPIYNQPHNIYQNPYTIPTSVQQPVQQPVQQYNSDDEVIDPDQPPIRNTQIEPLFSFNSVYLGDPAQQIQHERRYRSLFKYIEHNIGPKPQRRTIIRYGLQQYFPDIFPDYDPDDY